MTGHAWAIGQAVAAPLLAARLTTDATVHIRQMHHMTSNSGRITASVVHQQLVNKAPLRCTYSHTMGFAGVGHCTVCSMHATLVCGGAVALCCC